MYEKALAKTSAFSELGIGVGLLFAATFFFWWKTCEEWGCVYVHVAAYPWELVINHFLYNSYLLGFLFVDISRFDETAMTLGIIINAATLYCVVAGLQWLFRKSPAKRQLPNG
jgi:hypothetical protein